MRWGLSDKTIEEIHQFLAMCPEIEKATCTDRAQKAASLKDLM